MAVEKFSVAIDERVAAAARAAASREGTSLSAWLTRAAEQALRIDEGLRAVAEWESEQGPLTAGERAAAADALDALNGGRRAPAR